MTPQEFEHELARLSAKYSVTDIAYSMGVDRSTLYRWTKSAPPPGARTRIGDA